MGPGASKLSSAASQGWDSTRAAFAPLAEAARQGSANATKLPSHHGKEHWGRKARGKETRNKVKFKAVAESEPGHRIPTGLITFLAAAAVLGATGTLVARRRNRTRWAEYEPASVQADANSLIDSTKSQMSPVADAQEQPAGAAKFSTWAKDHTKSAVDTMRQKIHEATADGQHKADGRNGGRMVDGKDRLTDGDSAGHLVDKAEARMNDASERRGASPSRDSMANAGDRATDEVDDLLRSAKNGRV